ncbi:MAG: oxygenase MpaB family protein [Actinomycetota bacterium]
MTVGPDAVLPTRGALEAAIDPHTGLYPAGSATFETYAERTTVVSAAAQAIVGAHHSGLAAILEHSASLGDSSLTRADRTRDVAAQLQFGTPSEVLAAADHLWSMHSRIRADVDGCAIHASDPNLLAVTVVAGRRAAAAWMSLLHAGRHERDLAGVAAATDRRFEALWSESVPLQLAVGVPPGYLGTEAGDVLEWFAAEVAEHRTAEPSERTIECAILGLPQSFVHQRFSGWQRRPAALPAAALTDVVRLVSFFTFPPSMRSLADEIAPEPQRRSAMHIVDAIRMVEHALPPAHRRNDAANAALARLDAAGRTSGATRGAPQ